MSPVPPEGGERDSINASEEPDWGQAGPEAGPEAGHEEGADRARRASASALGGGQSQSPEEIARSYILEHGSFEEAEPGRRWGGAGGRGRRRPGGRRRVVVVLLGVLFVLAVLALVGILVVRHRLAGGAAGSDGSWLAMGQVFRALS